MKLKMRADDHQSWNFFQNWKHIMLFKLPVSLFVCVSEEIDPPAFIISTSKFRSMTKPMESSIHQKSAAYWYFWYIIYYFKVFFFFFIKIITFCPWSYPAVAHIITWHWTVHILVGTYMKCVQHAPAYHKSWAGSSVSDSTGSRWRYFLQT